MAQQDQGATAGGPGAAACDSAMNAINATTKNMQAIVGEMFDMSKQSLEHATQAMEKLRNARGMEEFVTIQTNYAKEAFEQAAQRARKFSELMAAYPTEIAKTCQDAWLRSVNSTVKATETASQTAAQNIERLSEAAKKASTAFEHRESA